MEAWLAMLARAPQPDIFQFWMPFFTQSMAPLAHVVSQGASAEVLRLWKEFLDQSIEGWAKALEQAMASEGFAAAFGKYMEQYLAAVGPAQAEMKRAGEEYLKSLGLPSRTQIAEMASQISWVESRIEELEAKIEQVLTSLAGLRQERGPSASQASPPR